MDVSREAQNIVAQLHSLEVQYARASIKAFRLLEQSDPDTVCLALEAFGHRRRAAQWFGDRIWLWATNILGVPG
jgi:hypothetical protein